MTTPAPQTPSGMALLDAIDPLHWQRFQDHLARVLGLPLRTIGPGHRLLVKASWPASLLNDQVITLLRAGEELEALLPEDALPQTCASVTMPTGASYAAAPIRGAAGSILAHFVVGPFVVGVREDELSFRQRMQSLRLDAAVLWPVVLSLKLFSFAGIRAVLDFLEELGGLVARAGTGAEDAAGHTANTSGADGHAAVAHPDAPVLHALLDAAVATTGADGGSVMMMEAAEDVLRVRSSIGLAPEVAATSRVARGQGLAGVVMDEGQIRVVDEATQDDRLRGRMQRREVVASILAPIRLPDDERPVGVLNLRTVTPGKRFDQAHVDVIRRLLRLAGFGLSRDGST